jgi:hypothetical protein
MGYCRNVFLIMVFALIFTGCGGGNSTIAANDTAGSSTGTGPGGTNGGGSGSSSGSLTLQWTPPTTLADGTTAISLSNISGYKLFYGPSATNTPNMISINSGTTTQYTLTLPTGSYYFVICAIDTNGNLGLKSVALQKSI